MAENTEEFIWYEVILALIVSLVMFFIFYQNFSQVFPIGCNNNNVLENQFSQAEFGYPNRMEGTPLFRCYLTDACYSQATANQTCITNWCYYDNCVNGQCSGGTSTVVNCIAHPTQSILQNCKDLSPSNTAALESCGQSTMVANNATDIQNCDLSVPTCVSGDSKYCAPCIGQ